MTLDTSQRREGYASRIRATSDVHRAPDKDQTPPEIACTFCSFGPESMAPHYREVT